MTTSKTNATAKTQALAEALEAARHRLGLATFDSRNSDRLDFYDLHVDTLREAVEAAFEAGYAARAAGK